MWSRVPGDAQDVNTPRCDLDREQHGHAEAGIRVTSAGADAKLLQLRDATESHISEDKMSLLTQIRDVVLNPKRLHWHLDSVVVFERVRAKRGFAALSGDQGRTLEITLVGDVPAGTDLELVGADLRLVAGSQTNDVLLFEFDDQSTPVFKPPIRVRQSLWARLLPWRRDDKYIEEPSGIRHEFDELPWDLSSVAPEDRFYDPARSEMSPQDLARLPLQELFEEVQSLPEPSPPRTPWGVTTVEEPALLQETINRLQR